MGSAVRSLTQRRRSLPPGPTAFGQHASPQNFMDTSGKKADWRLRKGDRELGSFTEVGLRQTLLQISDKHLDDYEVRQGNSPWHPARRVMGLFRKLARQGVYVRVDGLVQGPFTWQRAVEVIGQWSAQADGIQVKLGRDQPWQSATRFLRDLKSLTTPTPENRSSQPPPSPGDHSENVVPALPYDPASTKSRQPALPLPVNPTTPHQSPGDLSPLTSLPTMTVPTAKLPQRRVAGNRWVVVVAALGVVGVILTGLAGSGYLVYSALQDSPQVAGTSVSQGSSRAGSVDEPAPVTRRGSLFRPRFETAAGQSEAGTAFAGTLSVGDPVVIVTALHLLGEAGGFPRDITGAEVIGYLHGLRLIDCVSGASLGNVAGRPLSLPQARSLPANSLHGDVVAFLPEADAAATAQFNPLPLANRRAQPQEVIWMLAEVLDGRRLTHRGKVVGEQDGWLVYRFDSPINMTATSGAPIVDRYGEVVAVNAGGGEQDDGAILGFGTPVSKFRRAMADAIRP